MRSMIIGGAGFIGANLASRLASQQDEVTVLDLPLALDAVANPRDQSQIRRCHLLSQAQPIVGDVRDKGALTASIDAMRPRTIYYLAALPIVSLAEKQFAAAGDSMIRGLANALEAARAIPSISRFVYVSSSMVYGNFRLDPVPERVIAEPVNLYGGLKLAGEHLVKAYLGSTEVEHVVVRPSGVYGPGDPHGRVVQKFCTAALEGSEIRATNGADTFIDFTWVGDLVEGLARAGSLPDGAGETFNLTRGRARSLDELISVVSELGPGPTVVRNQQGDTLRPRRGTLDISKAKRLLGYNPQVDLEAGVARYARHLTKGRPAGAREHAVA